MRSLGNSRALLVRHLAAGVFLLWLAATAASAQLLPLINYSPDDGLSHSQIWNIYQDSRGYMWIGTTEGLNRFDGVAFTSFGVREGLKNVTIRTVIEDASAGGLWIGTDNGLTFFDGRTFKHYGDTPGAPRGTIWGSTRDRFGRIWFGSQYSGAVVLDGDRFRSFVRKDGLAHEYVYSIFADSRGDLWFGHRGAGVTRCSPDVAKGLVNCRAFGVEDGLAHNDVHSITEDRDGNVYFATRGGGVSRWDGGRFRTFNTKDGLAQDDVYVVLATPQNELLVGTIISGVNVCGLPDFENCRLLTMESGLPDNALLAAFRDRDDVLWLGFQTGLTRFGNQSLVNYTTRTGLPHQTVYSVLADPDGSVWIGTLGGLLRMPPQPAMELPPKSEVWKSPPLPDVQVWALHRDRRGWLWVATLGGLCRFEGGRCVQTFTHEDGLVGDDLVNLGETSAGDLLVTSVEGVSILHFDAGSTKPSIRSVTKNEGLIGSTIYAVVEDLAGRIWLGADQGLSCIDGNKVTSFTTKDGLPIDEIFALHRDRDGAVWIGTNGAGLVRFVPPRRGDKLTPSFRTFARQYGVPDSIAAIERGPDGTMWLGSTAGVALFDPAKALKSSGDSTLVTVDRATGLVGNEVNALASDRKGGLWIGFAGGAARFDASTGFLPPPPPRVTIESLRTDEGLWRAPFTGVLGAKARSGGWLGRQPLSLSPKMNSIRVDYRGLSFRDKARLRYQVQLVGFDRGWSDETHETFKEYTNLDPGKYEFRVRAAVRGGSWGTPATLKLELRPALWQTKWFVAFAVLGFILLLTVGYQWRTYAINRRNRELEQAVEERTDDLRRYARALEEHSRALDRANVRIREADRVKSEFLANMSHELRTPLNSIIGFSDVLVPNLKDKIDSREYRFLSNIQTAGRYLLLLINNLLDLSKIEAGRAEVFPEKVRIADLVENTCAIVQGYAADRRIEIVASVPPDMDDPVTDIPKFKQILLNLLSNAVKFSKSEDVVRVNVRTIQAAHSAIAVDSFELSVIDQGPGIRREHRDMIFEEFRQVGGGSIHPGGTGLGLALVKRFVKLLGGSIDVESESGKGSTFRILLPMRVQISTEPGKGAASRDGTQPRIIVVGESAHDAGLLATSLENEGFAPVRARGDRDAVRVARDIGPSGVIVQLGTMPDEGWEILRTIAAERDLSDLALGMCVSVHGRPAYAIAADALLLDPADPRRVAEIVREVAPRTGESPTVLVIDNNATGRHTYEAAITASGFTPRIAETAADALDLAIANQPLAVVVNLMLPSFAGFESVRRLQRDRRTRHVPVIVISSASGGRAAARDASPQEEPSYDDLALTLHELLRRQSARAVRLAARSVELEHVASS